MGYKTCWDCCKSDWLRTTFVLHFSKFATTYTLRIWWKKVLWNVIISLSLKFNQLDAVLWEEVCSKCRISRIKIRLCEVEARVTVKIFNFNLSFIVGQSHSLFLCDYVIFWTLSMCISVNLYYYLYSVSKFDSFGTGSYILIRYVTYMRGIGWA